MSRKIRPVVLVLVLAVLFTSSAYALPRAGSADFRAGGFFAAVWEWVAARFVPAPAPTKAGSSMDPNGLPGEAGSQMDPNGLVSSGTADEGSSMDPNGHK